MRHLAPTLVRRQLECKLALLLGIVVLAGVGASSAQAYRGGDNSPITLPEHKEQVKQWLRDSGYKTQTSDPPAVVRGTSRMQLAAKLLPALRLFGAVTIGTAIGVQIYDPTGDTFVRRLISGEPDPGGSHTYSWNWVSSGGTNGYNFTGEFVLGATGASGYLYCWPNQNWVPSAVNIFMHNAAGTEILTTNSGGTVCQSNNSTYLKIRTEAQHARQLNWEPLTSGAYTALPAPQQRPLTYTPPAITDQDYEDALDALGARDTTDRTLTDPDAEATLDSWNDALEPGYNPNNILMPGCIGLSEAGCNSALDTAGHTGTRTYVELGREGAVMTQPAGAVVTQSVGSTTMFDPDTPLELQKNPDPMPIEMFNPAGNETWDQYIARLQGAGYVGTVGTPEVLDPAFADPRYASGVPIRIQIGNPVRVTIRFPITTPVVRIWPNEQITPQLNPPGLPAPDPSAPGFPQPDGPGTSLPPGTAPPPGAPPPAPGGCTEDCGISLTPLTPTAACEKFPFGIVCWIVDNIETMFLAPAEAPHFEMTTPTLSVGPLGTIPPMTFGWDMADLPNEFNVAISLIRSVLAFLFWLGGLWFVGTRILGIRGAPDTEGMGVPD